MLEIVLLKVRRANMYESESFQRGRGKKGKVPGKAAANLGQSMRICRTVSRVSEHGHIGRGLRDI